MAIPVLILGKSGSGKTYSLKNMDPKTTGIFSVEKNRLPFKTELKVAKNATYEMIMKALTEPTMKAYVIDDSQFLMVNEFFDKAKDSGYGKYTDIGLHFRNLVHFVNKAVPDDVTVYFLHHTEDDGLGGVKAKTVGKMLDNYLTVEGCFDIVLLAQGEGKEHYFITQSDGYNTCKAPEDLLPERMPNDLKVVDDAIREYYGI